MHKQRVWGVVMFLVAGCAHVQSVEESVRERIEWSDIWVVNADQDHHPRVLLVGDSIVKGYYAGVAKHLADRADCARYATSLFVGDPDYLAELVLILKRYRFDVVHINNGLHGWGYTEEQYRQGLSRLLETLEAYAGGTTLIWATTTPIRSREDLTRLNQEKTKRVIERNRIAVELMTRKGVGVNDLYGLVENHPEYFSKDGVHYNGQGKTVQEVQVAKIISEHLSNQRIDRSKP